MDIVMPKADGFQALRSIKEIENNAKVIMLSSVGTASNLMEALRQGASDFIQKPYTNSQIANIIAGIKQRED
jgi:two-component system chemotaxis response regulator CheY